MSSTYTEKNNPFAWCTNKHSQLETFSQPYFNGIFQIAFPITVLPKDDHTDFAQEERLGLPYWTMILAICVVVDESKCLDIPVLEFSIIFGASSIFTFVQAYTASAAGHAHPGSLDMISMTFAAVICDADDLCSVNTA